MTPYTLLNYQETSNKRMLSELSHFLLYQMGLGKTPTTTKSIYDAMQDIVIILCPKNAIRTWEDHIKDWFSGLDAMRGEKTPYRIWRWRGKYNHTAKRHLLWQNYVPDVINVYIMTYAGYVADFAVLKYQPHIIICDECKRIRNRDSKAFQYLKHHAKGAKYFWPMTGTPGKLPLDIWTLFHLADPQYYRSYWKFVAAFHYMQTNEWGRKEVLGIRNQDQWYRTLKSKSSIVTKDMVAAEIGNDFTVQRQLLHVELDDVQIPIYNELFTEMMAFTDDKLIIAKTSLDRTLKLRQLLVCPKILNPRIQSYGSALEDLVETLTDGSANPRCAIFTPFVEAIPFIRERLAQAGLGEAHVLKGGTSPDDVTATIARFRAGRTPIICSIGFAESFSFEPASESYFLGYSYDPDDNKQAEFRLQRLTTNYPTNAYYYAYEGTYDEEQALIVCIKHQQALTTFSTQKAGLIF